MVNVAVTLRNRPKDMKISFQTQMTINGIVTFFSLKFYILFNQNHTFCLLSCWLRSPAVEHRSLAGVLSLSCARLVADG